MPQIWHLQVCTNIPALRERFRPELMTRFVRYAVAWRPQTLERIAVGRVKRCPVCNWLFLVSGGRRWDKHENAACYSPGCRYTWAEWCKYPDLHCVVCGHFTNKIVRFDAGVLPSFLWPTAIIATTEAYVCAEGSCERLHRLEMNGTMLANVLYTMASVTMREVRLRLVEWILQAIELAGNACIYCQKQLEDGETLTQVAVAPRVPLYGWNELVADMPLCAECRESTLEPLTQEAVV